MYGTRDALQIRGSGAIARFIAGEGKEKGGSAGGLEDCVSVREWATRVWYPRCLAPFRVSQLADLCGGVLK